MLGTTKFLAMVPHCGWERKNIGIWMRVTAMNANMARSHRRKLPVAMIATRATAAIGTADVLRDPGVRGGQRDPDELGHDREEVEDEQVADAEPAPAATEPLVDEPGVADAGNGTEADDHLLIDQQHRDQEKKGPEQSGVVVLPGLGVGGDAAGVVVAHHDDDPGSDDGGQRQKAFLPRVVFAGVAHLDAAERTLDVAEVGRVEDRRRARLEHRLVICSGLSSGRADSAASEPGAPSAASRSVIGYPRDSECCSGRALSCPSA